MEENPYAETQDFSEDLAGREKDKVRNVGVTPDPKKWARIADSLRKNVRSLERHIEHVKNSRDVPDRHRQEALRTALDMLSWNKIAIELLENNEHLSVSQMKQLFRDNGVGHLSRYRWAYDKGDMARADDDLLKRYPEASVEHKCPTLYDGWSSIEDCPKSCEYRQALDSHQYWQDMDDYMEDRADRLRPRTKEEILAKLPSGKHTKNLRETAIMSPEDFAEGIEQDQEEQDLLKMPHKDRKHY